MKPVEVKPNGKAEFELEMKLKNPMSKISLYKNGEIVDYGDGTNDSFKHNLKKVGDKYTFTISNVGPEDAGLYQVDVEDATMFSAELESKTKFDHGVKHVRCNPLHQVLQTRWVLNMDQLFRSSGSPTENKELNNNNESLRHVFKDFK
ncbi:immunoglobulin-like and fibronectin type III domain-containing protein 1 [Pangasianodon hypophthalmus]|uniref:immunoglobulin-like and fibronectin type III domain-containing protein 1 n=1 Tax=Pangasianodon hypophthalmus TaxID=310915 RepID=UPI00147A6A9B|nr:immunoglobulin-like and fibronectin type III domain-containing protein 1 isoform X2 [Pangasianodon hypophthalmus]XP_053092657.1 immunoglobulin-like and fibronectin type III domain-containing protein 1 [Pangasianodon hypophthalmus]